MNKNRRIAIIGSGISGASAAWLLRDHADVTLLEAGSRFGGHTHTFLAQEGQHSVAVDTGFMVFNRRNYPLLVSLFEHLGISSYPTDMSFSASFDQGRLEYAGTDINTLFGQRRNLVNPRFWGMLLSVVRFNRLAQQALQKPPSPQMGLEAFLERHGFSDTFRSHYLYPMAAAIAAGDQVYASNCAACHRSDLQGEIGPQLTGLGYDDAILYELIFNGIPDGGMPGFSYIGSEKVWQLVNFIQSKE